MHQIVRKIQFKADQETENIYIRMVYKLIDDTHDHRKSYVFFIINIVEQPVYISDENKYQAVKAKGTGIEHIHEESCSETIDHARQTAMDETY